jgi:DNA helicase-2/ATP-dependent DNA helicase PcrA
MTDSFYEDIKLIEKDVEQLEAYRSQDKTVVIAGPGSGKTRVLTLKAMSIIHSNSFPVTSGIACLSYSKETVRELKNRLKKYGYKKRPQDFIGTVHGFCLGEIIGPFQHLYPEYNIPFPFQVV